MRAFVPQKTIEASPEVKAFIYQQINEFESYLPVGSSVGVILHESHIHVVATIEIHSVDGTLQCHGVGQDPIEALVEAKNVAVFHLQSIEVARDMDDERKEDGKEIERPFRIHKYRH